MISTAATLGRETVAWGTEPATRVPRLVGDLFRGLLGQDPGTVAAHGVCVTLQDATRTHASFDLPNVSAREEGSSVGAEIFEIRRLSGLTWDELATIFGVSRRSLHHWANGKPISAAHEDQVRRTLATLRRIDRGEAQRNRSLLMNPCPDGGLVIDLLRRADFKAVERLVQAGPGRPSPVGRLSDEAAATRRPPSPAELVDARHDDPPMSRGRFVRIERVRLRQRPDQG